jgi:hypothetical protein
LSYLKHFAEPWAADAVVINEAGAGQFRERFLLTFGAVCASQTVRYGTIAAGVGCRQ